MSPLRRISPRGAVALFVCLGLQGQSAGLFSVDKQGVRSFAEAVRLLREKTGWQICLEEPVWPAKAQASGKTMRNAQGRNVEPPEEDRIRVADLRLRGPKARQEAIGALAGAFNAQNKNLAVHAESQGTFTILLPDKPAISPLSRAAAVPVAERAASEHVTALLNALQAETGISLELDTAAFGFRFDEAFSGKDTRSAFRWGAASQMARSSLMELLSRSATSTVWQVDCQAGVAPSQGHCILSLMPITVEVTDRAGKAAKRTLYFDRGGRTLPPPPPPQ